jgi:peroxiredoxin
MKNIFLLVVVLLIHTVYSQNKVQTDPIFIVNGEIVTKEKVEEYAQKGYIKKMLNGVNDEKYLELKKKFNDKITAKEFIILIELYSKLEMSNKKAQNLPVVHGKSEKIKNEYFVKIGSKSIDFNVKMIDGTLVNLYELRGKVVLLNFWATWCAPCIREFYEIPSKILVPFKNQNFVFLPIAIGQDQQIVKNKMVYLKKRGIEFNVGFDHSKIIWNKYANGSIPKNIIVDKNGVIRYLSTGNDGKSVDKLVEEIEKLVTE